VVRRESVIAISEINRKASAVSFIDWLGVFVSAAWVGAKSWIQLNPWQLVFSPNGGLRLQDLRFIERRNCYINP